MFDIVGLAKSALDVIAGFLGFQSKKLDLKNTEDMKAASERQDEQSAKDRTAKAIANKDADEIRKELAE